MSGVEVAGLALGALPILISAIESYNEGLDPIKSFVRWERELPRFIRKLRNEHVHYAQTMRQLLEPITTEFQLADMLAEPNGPLWSDEEMVTKLQDRLQESYEAYQSTIADVERIMKKIASKLDLERAAELKRNDLEAIIVANSQKSNERFEFRKRVKFGMNKKTIKVLLDELAQCNRELERFTERSEKFETTLRKSTKPSLATKLQHIQELARNLHSSILSSWSCSCRSHHKTNLLLDQRETLYITSSKKSQPASKISFSVSFATLGDSVSPWTWQEAEIQIEDDDVSSNSNPAPAELTPKLKMTKSVSFGDKPPPPYSAVDPVAHPTLTPELQEVKDLCASIHQYHKSSPCIGFSLDSKTKQLRGFYLTDSSSKKRAVSNDACTLQDLLKQPPLLNGRPTKLSKKERYWLAVTLASSALQLNSTPWFPDQWSARDILFHRMSSGPQLVDIDHPYVSPELLETSESSPNTKKASEFRNKNTILLALAVALLELYFGISAEQRQEGEGLEFSGPPGSNPWQLCAVAYEWAEAEQENLSAAFSNAVNHCLRCFSDPSSSLKDPEFLQAAVESIVLPLQDELYQFLGRPHA